VSGSIFLIFDLIQSLFLAPKPKKHRKSTSTGEDLEVSAIRPVNGEGV